jgi:hypothetical protein
MHSSRFISLELLEKRSMMSVSAATYAGPQTIGTRWDYAEVQSPTLIDTYAVVGITKIGKVRATHIHITHQYLPGASSDVYQIIDAKQGLLILQETDLGGGAVGTVTWSPQQIGFPALLAVGKTESGAFTRNEAETYNGKTTKGSTPFTYTRKLISDKTTRVTVPAGTFKCYQIQQTTYNKKVKGGYILDTDFVAPNVGLVREIQVEVSPGLPNYNSTRELQKFTAAK